MKKTETFVVLRSKETGQFLVEYKKQWECFSLFNKICRQFKIRFKK